MGFSLPKIFASPRSDHAVARSTATPVPASTGAPVRNETGGSSGRRNDAAPAQAGRRERARFSLNFLRRRFGLHRRSGETGATRGTDANHTTATTRPDTHPEVAPPPRAATSSSANVRSLENNLALVSNSLNTILQTDWEGLRQRISDAVKNDSLPGMSELLYSNPLRNFPMPAKHIVLIAHRFPEERNNPAFAKLLGIATGTGYQPGPDGGELSNDELSRAIHPVFNPGASLAKYYTSRSRAREAQSSTQARNRDDFSAEENDLREWAVISDLWIIGHELLAGLGHELQASRERIEVLAGAYSAYISSRGDSQGRTG